MGRPSDVAKELARDDAPAGALTPITAELIATQKTALDEEVSAEVRQLFGKPKTYRIGPGDIVNIVVWGHPELAMTPATSNRSTGSSSQADVGNGYNVNADGTVQYPFIGAVQLAGLTESEARAKLTRLLSKYVQNPQITVRVQAYRHLRIYVDGEVRAPGLQVMDDIPMTLPEAINRAGGFTPQADRSAIVLTRKDKTVEINIPRLTRLGVNPSRIMLNNGDLVRVVNRNESKVFVLGEVMAPGALDMRDGRLTLTEALGEAAGVSPYTSEPSQIYVIRKPPAPSGKELAVTDAKVFHLNANSPSAFLLANEFQLQPRDVVFVDPAPVVRWQRVISNITPSYDSLFINTHNSTK
ncbi:polysaccharide biosynthesis/export family protein [Paracandidimonas lactea]|uniref:polysaccharide biosynthesis/export family protein n=1 Tax=Paracandidimonas lactea TaxID=2895524 RepID=UPI001EF0E8B9|nr:polysaccharide biosynthesis/export family protein [Paracandidimonas lactea]